MPIILSGCPLYFFVTHMFTTLEEISSLKCVTLFFPCINCKYFLTTVCYPIQICIKQKSHIPMLWHYLALNDQNMSSTWNGYDCDGLQKMLLQLMVSFCLTARISLQMSSRPVHLVVITCSFKAICANPYFVTQLF